MTDDEMHVCFLWESRNVELHISIILKDGADPLEAITEVFREAFRIIEEKPDANARRPSIQ